MFLRRKVSSQLVAASGIATTAFRHQASAEARQLTYDEVWSHWNEGNLFSLQAQQLHSFLQTQRIEADPRSKKAALVRQVEELLQRNDDEAKGVQAKVTDQEEREKYGKWEAPTMKSETMLDLAQSGFYEAGVKSMAPRAFQVLVAGNSPDLVVSRVNTTSFPSFPASAECYTLIPADANLSARARYSKALQWCVMNMRNLQLHGEVAVEFGKLLIRDDVLRKNRMVVSAYTLQQRMQVGDPHSWVSCLPPNSIGNQIEPLLEANGFEPVNDGKSKVFYQTRIHRANDHIEVELNTKGATTGVQEPFALLQTAHRTTDGGPDLRYVIRSRQPLPRKDIDAYNKASIVDLTDEEAGIKVVLPPELGKVVYCSENEVRSWSKTGDSGVMITVKETKRQPLIVSEETENDERCELELLVTVPEANARIDLNAMGNEIFDLARVLGDAVSEDFVAEFGTQAAPLDLNQE